MKTKEELKDWFFKKFKNCYYVVHEDFPQSLFMYYDEIFIRKMKLCKLSGRELIYPKKPSGVCLFEQDYKNGFLYMNYDEITSFLYKNYSSKWIDVKELVNSWLKETNKMYTLTSLWKFYHTIRKLKETDKMYTLTSYWIIGKIDDVLKETDKMYTLTSLLYPCKPCSLLKETDKMHTLTLTSFGINNVARNQ